MKTVVIFLLLIPFLSAQEKGDFYNINIGDSLTVGYSKMTDLLDKGILHRDGAKSANYQSGYKYNLSIGDNGSVELDFRIYGDPFITDISFTATADTSKFLQVLKAFTNKYLKLGYTSFMDGGFQTFINNKRQVTISYYKGMIISFIHKRNEVEIKKTEGRDDF